MNVLFSLFKLRRVIFAHCFLDILIGKRAKMPYTAGFLDQLFRSKQMEGAKNFLFEKVPQTQAQIDQRTLSEFTKRLLEQQKEIAKINDQLTKDRIDIYFIFFIVSLLLLFLFFLIN